MKTRMGSVVLRDVFANIQTYDDSDDGVLDQCNPKLWRGGLGRSLLTDRWAKL